MNGHHYFIDGIMRSFEWLPLDENTFFEQIANGLVSEFWCSPSFRRSSSRSDLGAPHRGAVLTDVALGFLARSAPQFNIFVVGIPLKLIIGLVMLLLTVPSLIYVLQQLFSSLFEALDQLLRMMQGAG